MSLHPSVGRTLYRALLRGAESLEAEIARCGAARTREHEMMKRVVGNAMPKDLRGLLDVKRGDARAWTSAAARRVTDAALSPALEGVDGAAGFAALRHMHDRLNALSRIVHNTTSSATTEGVTVRTHSEYAGFQRARFQFRYTIRIENGRDANIRLLSRYWAVADLDGRTRDVQGPGVVGAFPSISPGDAFEYESSCPLQTPIGTQHGHFIFHAAADTPTRSKPLSDIVLQTDNAVTDLAHGRMLRVAVAPFSYRTPSHYDAEDCDLLLDTNFAVTPKQTRRGKSRSRGRSKKKRDESGHGR